MSRGCLANLNSPASVTCQCSGFPSISDDRRIAMHVIHRRGWEIPEHRATPEHVALNRRAFLGASAGLAAATLVPGVAGAQRVTDIPDPTKDLYPARRNEKYGLDGRPVTPEEINGNYNNFYEYGT